MRNIETIKPQDNYTIEVVFSNGIIKLFDFKPYLKYPVFTILRQLDYFKAVKNKKHFIEWEAFELDLSADTIWHDGQML
jgi:hypothetical protein